MNDPIWDGKKILANYNFGIGCIRPGDIITVDCKSGGILTINGQDVDKVYREGGYLLTI